MVSVESQPFLVLRDRERRHHRRLLLVGRILGDPRSIRRALLAQQSFSVPVVDVGDSGTIFAGKVASDGADATRPHAPNLRIGILNTSVSMVVLTAM